MEVDGLEKLGEGGEAEVFALDGERVIRRWRQDHPSIDGRLRLVQELRAGAGALDVELPDVLDHGVGRDGRRWFLERRLPGRSMKDALHDVRGGARRALIDSYLETAASLRRIDFARDHFGELLTDEPLRTPTWADYLRRALDRQVAAVEPELRDEIALDETAAAIRRSLLAIPEPEPGIVHFDYFPGNVLCDDRRITAVIDWSVLSVVGDPDLDLAMAVAYFGVTEAATDEDVAQGTRWLAERGLAERAALYERWAAAWWSPVVDDFGLRRWVRAVLDPPHSNRD